VSEQHSPRRQSPNRFFIAVLGTALYLALLVAAFGLTSLATDTDVVGEADAGPLLGPIMVVGAMVVVFAALAGLHGRRSRLLRAIVTTALIVVVMLLAGGTTYAVGRGDLSWLVTFPARYLLSPFVLEAAVIGGASVLLVSALFSAGSDSRNGGGTGRRTFDPTDTPE
jgi:Family of unknown function (DUF6121)